MATSRSVFPSTRLAGEQQLRSSVMRERHRTPAAQENVQELKSKADTQDAQLFVCPRFARGYRFRITAGEPGRDHVELPNVVDELRDVCWRPVLLSDARHSPSVAVCLVLQELLVELAMVILGSAARDGCVQEGASERSPHERQLRRLKGLLWLQWSSPCTADGTSDAVRSNLQLPSA